MVLLIIVCSAIYKLTKLVMRAGPLDTLVDQQLVLLSNKVAGR